MHEYTKYFGINLSKNSAIFTHKKTKTNKNKLKYIPQAVRLSKLKQFNPNKKNQPE